MDYLMMYLIGALPAFILLTLITRHGIKRGTYKTQDTTQLAGALILMTIAWPVTMVFVLGIAVFDAVKFLLTYKT